MWIYGITTGAVKHDDDFVTIGYSGHGPFRNDPSKTSIHGGPIPAGAWTIGAPFTSAHTGPFALPLTPKSGTDTFGRAAFEIHGDLIGSEGKFLASHGCIILDPLYRHRIWLSGDHDLLVVAVDKDATPVS